MRMRREENKTRAHKTKQKEDENFFSRFTILHRGFLGKGEVALNSLKEVCTASTSNGSNKG